MATGEYDFNENFRVSAGGESESQTELAFLPITAVIWLVFIPVMPILLINMLVCALCLDCNTENLANYLTLQ